MSTTVTLGAGQAQFFDSSQPKLKAGTFTFTAGIDFKQPSQVIPATLPTASQTVYVSGPHYAVAPGTVVSSYPPAGESGDYSTTLAQVVLSHPTLPWQRELYPSAPAGVPWLALLVFAPEELTVPANGNGQTGTGTASIREVIRDLPSGYVRPAFPIAQGYEDLSQPCAYIDMRLSVFQTVTPTLADLPYLAHARSMRQTGSAAGKSTDTPVTVSAVLANRLPLPGSRNIAHLVSLEGYGGFLRGGSQPSDGNMVRLVSLASWAFTCSSETIGFESRVDALSTGMLRVPFTPPDREDATQAAVIKALNSGYAPLTLKTREGEVTSAWYRGPLMPGPASGYEERASAYYTADRALIYDQTSGIFDATYAAAWQIGRLLALADKGFCEAVLAMRQTLATSLIAAVQTQSLVAHFGEALPHLSAWASDPKALPMAAARFLIDGLGPILARNAPGDRPLIPAARDPHGLLARRPGTEQ